MQPPNPKPSYTPAQRTRVGAALRKTWLTRRHFDPAVTCARCYEPLPDGATFCPRCGLPVGAGLRLRGAWVRLTIACLLAGFVVGRGTASGARRV